MTKKISFNNPIQIKFYDWLEHNLKTFDDWEQDMFNIWLISHEYDSSIKNLLLLGTPYIMFIKEHFRELCERL